MKGLITILAVLVVAGLAYFLYRTPSAPPEMTEAEIAQMEVEVEGAIADQWGRFKLALENEDYEAWASLWTADTWLLEPGIDLRGNDLFDTVRDLFESGFQVFEWNVRPAETFVHGDVAYQMGEMDEHRQLPGAEPTEAGGYFFARWEKESGVWKIDRLVVGPRDAPTEG